MTRFAEPSDRQAIGERIAPATADVFFIYAQTLDPYGDDPHLPAELQQMGREFFTVDPGEDVAVWWVTCRAQRGLRSKPSGVLPMSKAGGNSWGERSRQGAGHEGALRRVPSGPPDGVSYGVRRVPSKKEHGHA
jgi:hypothetical protein